MKFSNLFIPTLREDPAEAEVISHKLMVRAGMIRKLASGIYSYLPMGLKVLRKVEQIVREEMNRAGAQEIMMPAVQPGELWQESGRWEYYGKELLRFKDRHDRDYCLGPTHEEVVTDIIRKEVRSYRDLPINLYQIQQKFRDEIRPRFGLMRGREFGMKDAYSFDADDAGADKSYQAMFEAYQCLFSRCGLRFSSVEADSGAIGGSYSHEFMVMADTGEDAIANCPQCGYAANTEKAELTAATDIQTADPGAPAMEKVLTENMKTVEEVTSFLKIPSADLIKTMIFRTEGRTLAVLVRGDREVNPIKLKNIVGGEPELATPAMIEELTGAPVGFTGPVALKIPILADYGVKTLGKAVVGANEENYHHLNAVPGRDFSITSYHDLTLAQPGDPCPRCAGSLELNRGIEVGHVFKLGTKYSEAMQAKFLDADGREQYMLMGCYGIGIGRTAAAAIEQNHDENGIIWPMPLAPFEVVVLPLQMQDESVRNAAEKLYRSLLELGLDVLLDDRDERAGIKFKDSDLIGIPLRLSISRKTLAQEQVEFKGRTDSEVQLWPMTEAPQKIKEMRDQLMAACVRSDVGTGQRA